MEPLSPQDSQHGALETSKNRKMDMQANNTPNFQNSVELKKPSNLDKQLIEIANYATNRCQCLCQHCCCNRFRRQDVSMPVLVGMVLVVAILLGLTSN